MIQPGLRPSSIIVLGKSKLTRAQTEAWETFGYGLALSDQELLTTTAKGTALAVATGYTAAGRAVKTLDGAPTHNNVVAFVDDEFEKLLTKKLPDWSRRDWVIVTPDRLDEFMSIYLFVMDELGTSLLPEHGDGGIRQ